MVQSQTRSAADQPERRRILSPALVFDNDGDSGAFARALARALRLQALPMANAVRCIAG